ncbi:SDR family NAD(P)-dependent oxidoreductase [Clostridium sp. DMHC 10]|uniref:SDR family NAD(P)-dependent oxidoreductase n=1 Tax=Clostridium sp. DMHC 10 TaxID=747377 RepID=UPI000AA18E20
MGLKSYLKKKLVKVKKEKVIIPCFQGELLNGRNAFITGGSSGIGFAIAETFVKNGASVTICGRNKEKLENAKCKLLTDCGCPADKISTLELDLSSVAQMKNVLSEFLSDKKKLIYL